MEYKPARFETTLSNIRNSFPYLYELNDKDDLDRKAVLLDKLEIVSYHELHNFAGTLKSRELELLLNIGKDITDLETLNVINIIIKHRFRKKLFNLCWVMLQADYSNPGLINISKTLMECMRAEYPLELETHFLFKTKELKGSLPEKAKDLLFAEMSGIRGFCRKYDILENSIFSFKMCEIFFIQSDAQGFLNNEKQLIMNIDCDAINTSSIVFCSYLEKLKPVEYFDIVNNSVISRWGALEDDGEFWHMVDENNKKKFKSWLDLKKIEDYFGSENKRYKFWSMYLEKMKRIEVEASKGFLIMEFSNYIVLDNKDNDGWSYLYTKEYFEIEYARFYSVRQLETTQWRIISEHVADLRDLIIEGKKSDIYRIGYDKVHILYLKEVLGITVGMF